MLQSKSVKYFLNWIKGLLLGGIQSKKELLNGKTKKNTHEFFNGNEIK